MAENDRAEVDDVPAAGVVLVAFEKLFGGGRGVRRFRHSGLRHVELPAGAVLVEQNPQKSIELPAGAVLVEQNPQKSSEWAELARAGRRVAWVMRDGRYLARVVDGEVTFLGK